MEGIAMDQIWDKHKTFLARAASCLALLSAHDVVVILKNSLSLPKILYHLRCTFSGKHPTLTLLDAELRSMLCQILNVDLNDHQWQQASLPVKWGGLGIRKPTQVAPSAFLASVAGTSALVSSMLACSQPLSAHQGESQALTMWSDLGGDIPPTGANTGIQKCWDVPLIKAIGEQLLSEATDDYSRARLLAVSAPHAGDWLNAPPMSAIGLRMSNEALRVVTGLRLGANLCSPHTCRCTASVDARGNHGLSCSRSAGRQMRHSQLNSIVNRALSRAGIASIREPTGLVIGTSLRPDGATLIPWVRGKFLAWDATCPDTLHFRISTAPAARQELRPCKQGQ